MITYEELLDRARDVRSLPKLKKDIKRGNHNAKVALQGFCSWYFVHYGEMIFFDYYQEKFWTDMGKVRMYHDADLLIGQRRIPLSIKTDISPEITNPFFVRYYEAKDIITKRGKVLIATTHNFSFFEAERFWDFPVEEVEEWGNKKCFVLDTDKLSWKQFILPLEFI